LSTLPRDVIVGVYNDGMLNKASDELLDQLFSDGLTEYLKPWDGKGPSDDNLIIRLLELVLQYDPENELGHTDDALVFLPDVYIRKKEYKKAREATEKLIYLINKNRAKEYYCMCRYESYLEIGQTYYLENNLDKAIEFFNKSLEIDQSENYKAAYGLALCYRSKKQYKVARSHLNMARILKAMYYQRYPGIYGGTNESK